MTCDEYNFLRLVSKIFSLIFFSGKNILLMRFTATVMIKEYLVQVHMQLFVVHGIIFMVTLLSNVSMWLVEMLKRITLIKCKRLVLCSV